MENFKSSADIHQQNLVYDYTFIGLGAANSLLLIELLKHPSFSNKKIAVIDNSPKTNNDKTYCLWAEPNAPIVQDLSAIISRHYPMITINNAPAKNIGTQSYFYIKSLDLYQHTETLIQAHNIDKHGLKVNSISQDANLSIIQTDAKPILSKYIFDSRTPVYPPADEKEVHLEQSFFGLYVQCEHSVFNVKAFDMMNFDVDQDAYTQFVYVLPFSENEALIELTRFGQEKIEEQYARKILDEKILNDYGKYTIKGTERGSIPMTTQRIPASDNQHVLHTGARANLIKPSTGYAFKNMYEFAKMTSEKILAKKADKFNTIQLKTKKRFRFYDTLLLIILQRWPQYGKKIFSQLFNKQSVPNILQFLDNKSSYKNEISIFFSLSWKPFLKALLIYLKQRIALRYTIAAIVTVFYHLLYQFDPEPAQYFTYALLVLGFILVGIPHGAVDHLLYTRNKSEKLPFFIVKYLSIVAIGFILWMLFPILSLLVFIVYAAFHFGESEKPEHTNIASYIKAFSIGFLILITIIFSHPTESAAIISSFKGLSSITLFAEHYNNQLLIASALSFLALMIALKLSGKPIFSGLLFVLLAGFGAPLLLAFTLYFVFQHSCNAWSHICKGLSIGSVALYKKGLPYLLGALLIFVCMLLFDLPSQFDTTTVIATMFVFISCISLPHFVIMHFFYRDEG
jgi:lycopene beta-cyclase